MNIRNAAAMITLGATTLSVAPFVALASTTPLSVSCSGTAASTSIAWTASATGGVAPVALLWGNGATTTSQILNVAPGTYSMTLQATDASSTVATTSCSATVASTTPSGNPGSGGPSPFSGCPVPGRNLHLGSRGQDVMDMQQFLFAHDPDFASTTASGFFGRLTARAMARFQAANGIASSSAGSVGPVTRAFFGKHCGLIEGMGHLKGTAKSPFDMMMDASSSPFAFPSHGHGNGHGGKGHGHGQ